MVREDEMFVVLEDEILMVREDEMFMVREDEMFMVVSLQFLSCQNCSRQALKPKTNFSVFPC